MKTVDTPRTPTKRKRWSAYPRGLCIAERRVDPRWCPWVCVEVTGRGSINGVVLVAAIHTGSPPIGQSAVSASFTFSSTPAEAEATIRWTVIFM